MTLQLTKEHASERIGSIIVAFKFPETELPNDLVRARCPVDQLQTSTAFSILVLPLRLSLPFLLSSSLLVLPPSRSWILHNSDLRGEPGTSGISRISRLAQIKMVVKADQSRKIMWGMVFVEQKNRKVPSWPDEAGTCKSIPR